MMVLAPGTRLRAYEITALLGQGGMGEVYRARDTKLQRDVAIKILPAAFAQDADRLARFEREARTLASLNHPNIAQVYGLEGAKGPVERVEGGAEDARSTSMALVMEFVDGEDLAQRIARGAMPLDEALPIARQIAEALEAAHEAGIVHRDLKPANIKVRADGTVKVLDFGLAKAIDPGTGNAGRGPGDNAPTITTPAFTQAGVILGTAAYMSPEQARGRFVDRRADIWAFGCVLYEMLTGRRAFDGDTVSDTIATVLQRTPNLSLVPAAAPRHVHYLLAPCLEKDARQRLRDAGEARLLLEGVTGPPEALATAAPRAPWPIVASALAAAAVAGLASGWLLRPAAPPAQVAPSLDVHLNLGGALYIDPFEARPPIAISDDGTQLVYAVTADRRSRLVRRTLGEPAEHALPGTEGAGYPGIAFVPALHPRVRSYRRRAKGT